MRHQSIDLRGLWHPDCGRAFEGEPDEGEVFMCLNYLYPEVKAGRLRVLQRFNYMRSTAALRRSIEEALSCKVSHGAVLIALAEMGLELRPRAADSPYAITRLAYRSGG